MVNITPGQKVHFSLTGIRLTPLELKDAVNGTYGFKIDHTDFEVICTITNTEVWDKASLLKFLKSRARKESVKSKHRALFDYIMGSNFAKFRNGVVCVYIEPLLKNLGEGFVGRLAVEYCRDSCDEPKHHKCRDRVQLINAIGGSRLDYTPAHVPDQPDSDYRQAVKDKLREKTHDFLLAELIIRESAAK